MRVQKDHNTYICQQSAKMKHERMAREGSPSRPKTIRIGCKAVLKPLRLTRKKTEIGFQMALRIDRYISNFAVFSS